MNIGFPTMASKFPQRLGGRAADIPIAVLEHLSDLGDMNLQSIMEDGCDPLLDAR
jgi:hypothetical protein